jgi:UDP-glucose 4-epimerase
VNLLADTLERVAGIQPGRVHEAPRPGELLHSRLDTSRLQNLGWANNWTLEEGLRETYEHIANGRRPS